VGGIIAASVLISVVATKLREKPVKVVKIVTRTRSVPIAVTPELIGRLADADPAQRAWAGSTLFHAGLARAADSLQAWEQNEELRALMVRGEGEEIGLPSVRFTTGVAVSPETFDRIRSASGSPLADAPADQDVLEFELEFSQSGLPHIHLDILTTNAPGGNGAIARFLQKFGEGIQQVEIDVTDVDRATELLRSKFNLEPIYPSTRQGANGTRVNFFLIPAANNTKLLVEFVEQPKGSR
jgi:hypothetical protein